MVHSYLKKQSVYEGKNIPLDNPLKNRKGEITSEGQHMKDLEHLSYKINYRHGTGVLSHSKQERMLRAEIKKAVRLGHGKPFYNERIRTSEDSGSFIALTLEESKKRGLIVDKKAA